MSAQRSHEGPDSTTDRRTLDIVRHQALLREVNELVRELDDGFGPAVGRSVLCECGNPGCAERLDLTVGEYEAVRRFPARFVVKPGHELPRVERLIRQNGRFAIVEKFGDAGTMAVQFSSEGAADGGP